MEKTLAFLKECGTYYLGTVDGDQPEVRPFGTITKFEDKLYFQTGRVKAVFAQIMANPKVTLCAFNAATGAWIRVNATAVIDERPEASEAVLEDYPSLRKLYAADDGNCIVFWLKDATSRICSFTAPEEVETF